MATLPYGKRLSAYFTEYAAYHQNNVNELIHKIMVPIILITILMMFDWLPFSFHAPGLEQPFDPVLPFFGEVSYGLIGFVGLMIFYLSLDLKLGLAMSVYVFSFALADYVPWPWVLGAFVVAWIFQFIGHGLFEGKSPAFATTPIQLLIGPIYVMALFFGADFDGITPQDKEFQETGTTTPQASS